ncbi:hypothetical protein WMY93_025262 [Mugilogobius chulae]|uniref:C-type lectin domain-containing protein n=1 Tax=Mugilogobius chulae TaxID=88201 RepID=A0AAW0NBV9_9GOBI
MEWKGRGIKAGGVGVSLTQTHTYTQDSFTNRADLRAAHYSSAGCLEWRDEVEERWNSQRSVSMMKLLVALLFVGAVTAKSTGLTPKSVDDVPLGEDMTPKSVDDVPLGEDMTPKSVDDVPLGEVMPGIWQSFNGRSFMYVTNRATWSGAQAYCMTLGGSLASVHNFLEEDFVSHMTDERAWIGLSDAQNEGKWLWINSEPLTYTKWCPGEPNNYGGRQHCAVINYLRCSCRPGEAQEPADLNHRSTPLSKKNPDEMSSSDVQRSPSL